MINQGLIGKYTKIFCQNWRVN